jgi:hypothetical protein
MRSTHGSQRRMRLPTQAAGEAARRVRDRQLTMSERLERVHLLCAQMASITPIRRRPSG